MNDSFKPAEEMREKALKTKKDRFVHTFRRIEESINNAAIDGLMQCEIDNSYGEWDKMRGYKDEYIAEACEALKKRGYQIRSEKDYIIISWE